MKKNLFLKNIEQTIPEHIFPYNNLTIQVIHISLQNQIQSNLDKRMIFNGFLAATVIQRKYEDFSLSVLHTRVSGGRTKNLSQPQLTTYNLPIPNRAN